MQRDSQETKESSQYDLASDERAIELSESKVDLPRAWRDLALSLADQAPAGLLDARTRERFANWAARVMPTLHDAPTFSEEPRDREVRQARELLTGFSGPWADIAVQATAAGRGITQDAAAAQRMLSTLVATISRAERETLGRPEDHVDIVLTAFAQFVPRRTSDLFEFVSLLRGHLARQEERGPGYWITVATLAGFLRRARGAGDELARRQALFATYYYIEVLSAWRSLPVDRRPTDRSFRLTANNLAYVFDDLLPPGDQRSQQQTHALNLMATVSSAISGHTKQAVPTQLQRFLGLELGESESGITRIVDQMANIPQAWDQVSPAVGTTTADGWLGFFQSAAAVVRVNEEREEGDEGDAAHAFFNVGIRFRRDAAALAIDERTSRLLSATYAALALLWTAGLQTGNEREALRGYSRAGEGAAVNLLALIAELNSPAEVASAVLEIGARARRSPDIAAADAARIENSSARLSARSSTRADLASAELRLIELGNVVASWLFSELGLAWTEVTWSQLGDILLEVWRNTVGSERCSTLQQVTTSVLRRIEELGADEGELQNIVGLILDSPVQAGVVDEGEWRSIQEAASTPVGSLSTRLDRRWDWIDA